MLVSERLTFLAAVASASALVLGGAGAASAQGSLGAAGSSDVVPVFDSESEGALTPLGEGIYRVGYTNRSGQDLACAAMVLPRAVAQGLYEEMQEPGALFPGTGDDEGDPEAGGAELSPELQAAYEEAVENGHIAMAVGDDGLSYRDYMRVIFLGQMGDDDDYTDEQIEELLDEYFEHAEVVFPGLGPGFVNQNLVNFVDDGATAQWTATMDEALPEGERAGGIVTCFNGVDRTATITETTYIEIERVDEGTNAGGGDDDDDEGIIGSIEGVFGSMS